MQNQPNIIGFVHWRNIRKDGTMDSLTTEQCEVKISELWWQKQGLSYTASGYGSRIPTRFMIKVNGKWRRVYCKIYSNNGTLFIGKKYTGENTVSIDYQD